MLKNKLRGSHLVLKQTSEVHTQKCEYYDHIAHVCLYMCVHMCYDDSYFWKIKYKFC